MAQFKKWIEGVSADESTREAAQHSLRARLAAVKHYLPLAAHRADEDVEHVHQLRVYTRRSMAALKLYGDLLPKKETKWFAKSLRRVRRAAGNARDLDVLAQGHETDSGKGARQFLSDIRQRREVAQRPIVAIHRKLKRDDLLCRQIEKLLRKTSERTTGGSFGRWANSRLRRILKRFFKASRSNHHDLASLHRFRIRGKELRYAMELLAPAFASQLREELYPVIAHLQERLGEIHDHAVASIRFRKWIAETTRKREAAHVRKLLEQENCRLDRLLHEFASWWTPEYEAQLGDSFERLIAESLC